MYLVTKFHHSGILKGRTTTEETSVQMHVGLRTATYEVVACVLNAPE